MDVCLTAAHVGVTVDFYRKLGFEVAEGDADEEWLVLTDGAARLGIFAEAFMDGRPFSLIFLDSSDEEIAAIDRKSR